MTALRADTALTAIVPPDHNYGMRSPADPPYPFTRYGSTNSLPLLGTCMNGATTTFTIHAFSQGDYEDECASIDSAVITVLDGAVLPLEGGGKARLMWKNSQIVPDSAEASVWHGINQFEAAVLP